MSAHPIPPADDPHSAGGEELPQLKEAPPQAQTSSSQSRQVVIADSNTVRKSVHSFFHSIHPPPLFDPKFLR